MKNSLETLDDMYSMGHHDQKAYNALIHLQPTQEEFVWTACPVPSFQYYKESYKELNKNYLSIPFIVYIIFLQRYATEGHFFLMLIIGSSVLQILITLLLTELWRRKTFYGISKGNVWVKKPNKKLQCYPVAELPRLKVVNNSLYYSTIKKQEYHKFILFKSIPSAQSVYVLLKEYQAATP